MWRGDREEGSVERGEGGREWGGGIGRKGVWRGDREEGSGERG